MCLCCFVQLCRVRFYTFVGQPFLKQLYMRSLTQQGSNPKQFCEANIYDQKLRHTVQCLCASYKNQQLFFLEKCPGNDHAMFKFVDHKICGIDLVSSSTAYRQNNIHKLLTYKVTVKRFICTHIIFEFCHNKQKAMF